MSKLMIIFVLFMSGALYDPPRVLNQLGPEAAAIGWKIASTLGRAEAEARMSALAAILRDASLRDAPQDEAERETQASS